VLHKQPKFNHLFNKRVNIKISVPTLIAGNTYSFNIPGFRNTTSAMFLYFTKPENEIRYTTLGNNFWHIFSVGVKDVWVSNSTGSNVLPSNIKQDTFLNNYNLQNHFGKFNESLNRLCLNSSNVYSGFINFLSFS
jgi:hypothetical protein